MEIKDCKNCDHIKTVHATGGFKFKGCYCHPYKGKWIVEIKECPKKVEVQNGQIRVKKMVKE